MRRREFITGLGAAALNAWPAAAQRLGTATRRIGFLSPQSVASAAPLLAALKQGLRELGWTDGQNITFEPRYADGVFDLLAPLAAELVHEDVDVIVAGS